MCGGRWSRWNCWNEKEDRSCDEAVDYHTRKAHRRLHLHVMRADLVGHILKTVRDEARETHGCHMGREEDGLREYRCMNIRVNPLGHLVARRGDVWERRATDCCPAGCGQTSRVDPTADRRKHFE